MKDHPILMNGEMVRAHMAGRKTQTRRPVKPQPPAGFNDPWQGHNGQWFVMDGRPGARLDSHPLRSPFGRPGDTLWVREMFAAFTGGSGEHGEYDEAEGPLCDERSYTFAYRADGTSRPARWRPSIHMPRAASRITLNVKRVWVERVQDIAEADAVAEGLVSALSHGEWRNPSLGRSGIWTARNAFAVLWDYIYAKRCLGWDVNPWVWACEFEVAA